MKISIDFEASAENNMPTSKVGSISMRDLDLHGLKNKLSFDDPMTLTGAREENPLDPGGDTLGSMTAGCTTRRFIPLLSWPYNRNFHTNSTKAR